VSSLASSFAAPSRTAEIGLCESLEQSLGQHRGGRDDRGGIPGQENVTAHVERPFAGSLVGSPAPDSVEHVVVQLVDRDELVAVAVGCAGL